jgi:hypothetical protein
VLQDLVAKRNISKNILIQAPNNRINLMRISGVRFLAFLIARAGYANR